LGAGKLLLLLLLGNQQLAQGGCNRL